VTISCVSPYLLAEDGTGTPAPALECLARALTAFPDATSAEPAQLTSLPHPSDLASVSTTTFKLYRTGTRRRGAV